MRHTYVKSCANCGKYFESTRENAKFCCNSCGTKARNGRRIRPKIDLKCPHNQYLACKNHKCGSCGWNPEVLQRRMGKSLGNECTEPKEGMV